MVRILRAEQEKGSFEVLVSPFKMTRAKWQVVDILIPAIYRNSKKWSDLSLIIVKYQIVLLFFFDTVLKFHFDIPGFADTPVSVASVGELVACARKIPSNKQYKEFMPI